MPMAGSPKKKYATSALECYRRKLRQIYPHIGHIRLDLLRPIALENLLAKLRKRSFRGNLIRAETVQKHLTTASAVLSDAKRNEIIFPGAHLLPSADGAEAVRRSADGQGPVRSAKFLPRVIVASAYSYPMSTT